MTRASRVHSCQGGTVTRKLVMSFHRLAVAGTGRGPSCIDLSTADSWTESHGALGLSIDDSHSVRNLKNELVPSDRDVCAQPRENEGAVNTGSLVQLQPTR